jgi:mannose-6-phosphate isomerase class I
VIDGTVWRKTSQRLAPATHTPSAVGHYDLHPGFPVGPGKIDLGFEALADLIAGQTQVILDGYGGVFWEDFRERLEQVLKARSVRSHWVCVEAAMRPSSEIDALAKPFLGGADPIFGTRFSGSLEDFFDAHKLEQLRPDAQAEVNLIYGCGASLAAWDGMLVYLDVPKNEIQFRSRSGSILNLGSSQTSDAKSIYKRLYFVDWIALNQHKANLLERIDVIVDHQRPDEPSLMRGNDFRAALEAMTHNFFRARPWFEPGPWGGQWIKHQVPELPQDAPNYAWSFELITPENGLALESDGMLLEVSFDFVMFHDHRAVLGEAAERFGFEFPIRFDWLDTVKGGNLSVQVHPSPAYAKQHFGEGFTQDETYYILEAEPEAEVYLGFQDSIDPSTFRAALEQSHHNGTALEVEQFVQRHPARKHDLFLIPHGTIHCSGAGSVVLEISATPYIFTFKMYDWLRLDLDGNPRPMNIERAFENLDFSRRGERVQTELISKPVVLEGGDGWQVVHLPTHTDHFYDIQRLEFTHKFTAHTANACHILSLVEGTSIILETEHGMRQRFNYAETFVIPAAAGSYTLENLGPDEAKVIRAFVKPTLEPITGPTLEPATQPEKP